MSVPATKRPRPLAELCHDALAEGVIAKHGGLPASWLERFQEDEAVMAQLRDLVLDSTKREAVLHPDSRVAIVVQYPNHSSAFGWWQMAAGALGGWQFALLEAYFQGLAWYGNPDPNDTCVPEHDPHGGYRINWDEDDWMKMWDDMVRWHECHYQEAYVQLTHTLLDAFEIDVATAFADEIQRVGEEQGDSEFFDDWSAETIADFFAPRTAEVLRQALYMEVSTLDRKRAMMWDLEDMRPDPKDPPSDHKYQRASFCTLFFNLRVYV